MNDLKAGMKQFDARLAELESIQRSMALDLEAARNKALSTAEGFAEVRGHLAGISTVMESFNTRLRKVETRLDTLEKKAS